MFILKLLSARLDYTKVVLVSCFSDIAGLRAYFNVLFKNVRIQGKPAENLSRGNQYK